MLTDEHVDSCINQG